MTLEQEALELFNSMKGFRIKHTHSGKCAKIAVDRVIAELTRQTEVPALTRRIEDLRQIKLEIDKLCKKK